VAAESLSAAIDAWQASRDAVVAESERLATERAQAESLALDHGSPETFVIPEPQRFEHPSPPPVEHPPAHDG
jgi:hypothetical protein